MLCHSQDQVRGELCLILKKAQIKSLSPLRENQSCAGALVWTGSFPSLGTQSLLAVALSYQ